MQTEDPQKVQTCAHLQKEVGNVLFQPGSVVPPKKPGSLEKGGVGV